MRQWTVDAFASKPFRGNPACVVEPFATWPEDRWMQSLAQENNQAETAFLCRTGDPARFDLRWFTPTMEVPLCGHATLAAAHVLFSELGSGAERLSFNTRSGELRVRRAGHLYEMDFPSDPPAVVTPPAGLEQALGAPVLESFSALYLTALVSDETTLRGLQPDIAAIARLGEETRGGPGNLIAVAAADPGRPYQVVSRFFAPGSGVAEDPTTGSAHCILAPLFAARLGASTVRFHQAFPGRGGDLECEVRGDRVLLRGAAVTVMETQLRL